MCQCHLQELKAWWNAESQAPAWTWCTGIWILTRSHGDSWNTWTFEKHRYRAGQNINIFALDCEVPLLRDSDLCWKSFKDVFKSNPLLQTLSCQVDHVMVSLNPFRDCNSSLGFLSVAWGLSCLESQWVSGRESCWCVLESSESQRMNRSKVTKAAVTWQTSPAVWFFFLLKQL